ncbi:alpha/beta hydrolase [Hymenobacter rubripertinctus]|uniref:Alpha/beta hydrolase n=1 Tax=Hymenobacter rubripertinctus TaxID=2029981 RepID=A0A418R639_9BACT|nr:alpha/beta hydrolase [Hymenobacter rubripertinctus]RIY12968.1 alpha/beta hydrolase [Hymenobacter rubripertinctus]
MKFVFFRVLPVLLVGALLLLAATEYAVARPSRRTANVAYVPATDSAFSPERHLLDVYAPRAKATAPRPVVVFIHGGSWNSGNKNFYSFIGRRLAKQGVVAVVINYRLAPQVRVPQMADDCARAVLWTQTHIGEYGGDPQRIFLLGHSAGGGLAALLAADDALFRRWGQALNPVRGAVLDDPAGLDMYDYLKKMQYPGDAQYLVPFGPDPAVWRQVSPMYHLTAHTPPMQLFVGGQTYPSISSSSARFRQKLTELGHAPHYQVLPGKKHAPMVLQLYWQHNIIYQKLLALVNSPASPK